MKPFLQFILCVGVFLYANSVFANWQQELPAGASSNCLSSNAHTAVNRDRDSEWEFGDVRTSCVWDYSDREAGPQCIRRKSYIANKKGSAHVFLGSDNRLDDVVVMVQGFDIEERPLACRYDEMNGRNFSDSRKSQDLIDQLRRRGQDVIIVTFSDPSESMTKNAEVVEDVIERVNAEVGRSGRINAIGFSMGGVILRYALANMERRGNSHNVENYISYDAPHRGAIIPNDLIDTVTDFKDDLRKLEKRLTAGLASFVDDDLKRLIKTFRSPAARQLVLHPNYSQERADFQKALASAGNWPKESTNIAFSNGTVNTNQGIGGSGVGAKRRVIEWSLRLRTIEDYNYKVYANDVVTYRRCRSDLSFNDTIRCNDLLELRKSVPSSWIIETKRAAVDNQPGGYGNFYTRLISELNGAASRVLRINNDAEGEPLNHAFILTSSATAGNDRAFSEIYTADNPSMNEPHLLISKIKKDRLLAILR